MTGVTVRPAVAADIDGIRDVAARGWTAAYGDFLPRSVIDAAMAEWYDPDEVAARVAGDGAFFVADDGDDGVIGYVGGAPADDDPDEAALEAIYVDPDRWGEGVGSRLLRRFETWCRDRGRPWVRLRVLAGKTSRRRSTGPTDTGPSARRRRNRSARPRPSDGSGDRRTVTGRRRSAGDGPLRRRGPGLKGTYRSRPSDRLMSPRDSLAALVDGDVSRLLLARVAVAVAVLALQAPAAASYATYEETTNQRGTLESVADDETVVSVQGFHFEGEGSQKKPSGLVGVDRRGQTAWTLNGSTADWPVETADQSWWFYDVDPLPNGNLLVVNTFPGETFVHEYDPETGERVWGERFPEMVDTHDVASLNDEEIAIANMRNYDEASGVSDDRVVVYNRTRGEITWE